MMAAQGGRTSYHDMMSQYPSSTHGHSRGMGIDGPSSNQSAVEGAYGQRGRVGTPQLVELLQRQHAVFLQVASRVAETHEYCDK